MEHKPSEYQTWVYALYLLLATLSVLAVLRLVGHAVFAFDFELMLVYLPTLITAAIVIRLRKSKSG